MSLLCARFTGRSLPMKRLPKTRKCMMQRTREIIEATRAQSLVNHLRKLWLRTTHKPNLLKWLQLWRKRFLNFYIRKILLREDLTANTNILTARFLLAIKTNADGQIQYYARYVQERRSDRIQQYMLHGVQFLLASSARLLLPLVSAFNFVLKKFRRKTAFLQLTEPLVRGVNVKRTSDTKNWRKSNTTC